MKNTQKTPASVTTGGHREELLALKKPAHRTAACTGKTRLREQDSNLQPPGYEPGALPIAPSRDSFKQPHANGLADHLEDAGISQGVTGAGLLPSHQLEIQPIHNHHQPDGYIDLSMRQLLTALISYQD